MVQTFTLTVNRRPRSVVTEPDRSLLDVLRHEMGLVGPRFGCGTATCGACFVLVDAGAAGRAAAEPRDGGSAPGTVVPSCDRPMWSVDGASVTTVEGLPGLEAGAGRRDDGALHRAQQAVLDEQAGQCAYCLSGILVSAAALLAENPRPSEHDVAEALDRHLCRCGVHPRVVRAVVRAGRAPEPS